MVADERVHEEAVSARTLLRKACCASRSSQEPSCGSFFVAIRRQGQSLDGP